MLEAEETPLENFAQARARIQHWAKRIEDDYRATSRDFEDLEELRNHIIEEFGAADIREGERFFHDDKTKI
jgi:hypothetical protein